jgi:DNA-binding XRE family transcriptional regulator
MNAPEELKAWRAESGLSQEQAAERVGVRAATWCDWENGKKDPRTDRAQDVERLTEGRVTLAMWAEWAREKAARKEPEHVPTERAS